jgi:cation diffusion facilitator family transporter
MHKRTVFRKSGSEEYLAVIRNKDGRKVTLRGAAVNVFLIALKLVGGYFGRSQALVADAVHSLSDLVTDAVVLIGLRVGGKAADEGHPFGHGRFETLSSAVIGLALLGVAIYLGVESGLNIYHHTEHHPTWVALGAAGLSIIFKEILYRYTIRVGRRLRSGAIVANAWHHRSDALSSVAVFIGVGGAQIRPAWHILDAYAALVVAFLIAKVGLEVLWASVREFTDSAPRPQVLERILFCARSVEGVIDLHDLKVRTSGGLFQMELHVVIDGELTVRQGHRIAKDVEKCLVGEFEELSQVIVHVDPSTQELSTKSPPKDLAPFS